MTGWVPRLAAHFGFGADLQVRDLPTGNVVYREVLAFVDTIGPWHRFSRAQAETFG
jgi:hypothetical protein